MTTSKKIEILTETCAIFGTAPRKDFEYTLVQVEDGRWTVLNKAAKVLWASDWEIVLAKDYEEKK